MKYKKLMTLIGLLLIVVLVTACAPAVEEPAPVDEPAPVEEPVADEIPYVPMISMGYQHAYWLAVELGAERAAEKYGVRITYEGPETETQVDRQMDMLQAAIDRDPDAICLAALDSRAAIPLLEQAQSRGIPVVNFDTTVDSDIPVSTAATDNRAAAAYAADMMAELIGGSGEVAIIGHSQTDKTGVDRVGGFRDRIESEYPDITIVDIQYGDGDHLRSTDLAKAIILANPDLKGLFGSNEGSAVGLINAVTELGRDDLVLIGYDSGQQQLDAIRSGLMAGAISQDPVGIGYQCVWAAFKAIQGEEVPEFIDTGFYWYTAENMDDPDINAVLYE